MTILNDKRNLVLEAILKNINVEKQLKKVIIQYQQKNIIGLLRAFLTAIDKTINLIDLDNGLNLEVATGSALDRYGILLGTPRIINDKKLYNITYSLTDEEYRELLKIIILCSYRSLTSENTREIFNGISLFKDSQIIFQETDEPASIRLIILQQNVNDFTKAVLSRKNFPIPAGVGYTSIVTGAQKFFGFRKRYNQKEPDYITGFPMQNTVTIEGFSTPLRSIFTSAKQKEKVFVLKDFLIPPS